MVNTQLGLHLEMKKKHSSAIEEEEDQVDVPLRDQRKKMKRAKQRLSRRGALHQGELNIASKEIIDVRGITDVGMMNAIIAVEEDTMLEIVDSRKSQQKATW